MPPMMIDSPGSRTTEFTGLQSAIDEKLHSPGMSCALGWIVPVTGSNSSPAPNGSLGLLPSSSARRHSLMSTGTSPTLVSSTHSLSASSPPVLKNTSVTITSLPNPANADPASPATAARAINLLFISILRSLSRPDPGPGRRAVSASPRRRTARPRSGPPPGGGANLLSVRCPQGVRSNVVTACGRPFTYATSCVIPTPEFSMISIAY